MSLYNNIIKKQGDLLYTTLAEECSELSKACCKINRKKFFNKELNVEDFENLFEEISDVELNLKLIKMQIAQELDYSDKEIESFVSSWGDKKHLKLKEIFGDDDNEP